MDITRESFGRDFHWGVATAAYQVEGGFAADGKGLSIWDEFTDRKRKISGNEHGRIACDHYHRYYEDILLMKQMNIPDYRFSISWSRIFPDGCGQVNRKGVEFYHRVIDCCLEAGIEPWITLYHWDLPLKLQEKGGWVNRDIIGWFSEYTAFCVREYGDRVQRWMVLNEPMVFTGAGYFLGMHAPGKKGLNNFLASAHHAALCQSAGGRIIKSWKSTLQAGTTFSCSLVEPYRDTAADRQAQVRVDALLNRMFIEPLLGYGYPSADASVLRRMERFMRDGDEQQLSFAMDFIGIQNYTRELVRYDFFTPFLQAKIVHASRRNVPLTEMGWEVYPPSIYLLLKKYARYENIPPMVITESGAAFRDELVNGFVEDKNRLAYLKDHLQQVLSAKSEGVIVDGFFVWSFLDNFEWAEGYRPRFGLVHVDFTSLQRTIKSSGNWYSKFLYPSTCKDHAQTTAAYDNQDQNV